MQPLTVPGPARSRMPVRYDRAMASSRRGEHPLETFSRVTRNLRPYLVNARTKEGSTALNGSPIAARSRNGESPQMAQPYNSIPGVTVSVGLLAALSHDGPKYAQGCRYWQMGRRR
jgi:hypothetical protein